MGALLHLVFFVIINIQEITICEELMLSAQERSEGVTFFINNGTENVILYTLNHMNLSQEKGSNMLIDYVNNSHAIIYIALNGGIGVMEIVKMNDLLKVTRTRFVTLNPCSPGLIFKRDGIIFSFCYTYRYNLIGICLARVALPRNFDLRLFYCLSHFSMGIGET